MDNFANKLTVVICFLVGHPAMAEYVKITEGPVVDFELSDDGMTVVGHICCSVDNFLWTRNGGIRPLPNLPAVDSSHANDVSSDGSLVVGSSGSNAVTWNDRDEIRVLDLATVENLHSRASAVSSDGRVVVGTSTPAERPDIGIDFFDARNQAFRWTEDSGLVGLGLPAGTVESWGEDVSADGRIVLASAIDRNRIPGPFPFGTGPRAELFLWDNDSGFHGLGPLSELENEQIYSVTRGRTYLSKDGRRVIAWGRMDPSGFDFRRAPLLWSEDEGFRILPMMPGVVDMVPADLSWDGSVVIGTYRDSSFVPRPFVWDEVNGTRDLREVLIDEHGMSESELPDFTEARKMSADQRTIIVSNSEPFSPLWAIFLDQPLISILGDVDASGVIDVADINLLSEQIRLGATDDILDVDANGAVDERDRQFWVHEIARTYFGDSDLSREFDSTDLVAVTAKGQYEDALPMNSSWESGDWDGDGDFTTADLVVALADGGYEQGPRAIVSAVPEPAGAQLLSLGLLGLSVFRRAFSVRQNGDH